MPETIIVVIPLSGPARYSIQSLVLRTLSEHHRSLEAVMVYYIVLEVWVQSHNIIQRLVCNNADDTIEHHSHAESEGVLRVQA